MYIQMGMRLILEEAAAASQYRPTGKPYPSRGVAGFVVRECVYKAPQLTPCAVSKGIPTTIATGPQTAKTVAHTISHRRRRFMLLSYIIFPFFTICASYNRFSWSNINNGGSTIGDCEILRFV